MSCQALRVHWQPRVLQLPTNQLCSAPCILRLAPLQVVFTSLALFNVLLGPINALPWVLNGCGQPCGLLPCAPCILLGRLARSEVRRSGWGGMGGSDGRVGRVGRPGRLGDFQ